MFGHILLLFFIAGCYTLTAPPITGTTPEPVPCPDSLCKGKADGNYEYRYYGGYRANYFLQCSGAIASCQPCFPSSLEFSQICNQCLYHRHDECISTAPWVPLATFQCPDLCPARGPHFSGNIHDPSNAKHYVGCWHGQTVGCVPCPKGLFFNEQWNACLFEGKYKTERN